MRASAVLEDIDPLPRTQRKIPTINWNRQAGVRQHRADMGGCVVRAFQIMTVPGVPFRDQALQKSLKVSAGSWVPVLAHYQRCASVWQKEEADAFANIPGMQLRTDGF